MFTAREYFWKEKNIQIKHDFQKVVIDTLTYTHTFEHAVHIKNKYIIFSIKKLPGIIAQTCNSTTWEAEAGVQGHSQLQIKFEAS